MIHMVHITHMAGVYTGVWKVALEVITYKSLYRIQLLEMFWYADKSQCLVQDSIYVSNVRIYPEVII